MKRLSVFIIFLVVISGLANAKTVEQELSNNENIEVPGYNITLLSISANKKSIVACINNEKYIINKESRKEIENLKIEPIRIHEDYIRLKVTYSCEACTCNQSCSNNLCFSKKDNEESIVEMFNKTEDKKNNIEAKEDIKSISILLLLIVSTLLALLLIKRKKKR